jgi:hypothetical protein
VRKGGRVVCAGIHTSDIPAFPYRLLWEERELLSVANLTRSDGDEQNGTVTGRCRSRSVTARGRTLIADFKQPGRL